MHLICTREAGLRLKCKPQGDRWSDQSLKEKKKINAASASMIVFELD